MIFFKMESESKMNIWFLQFCGIVIERFIFVYFILYIKGIVMIEQFGDNQGQRKEIGFYSNQYVDFNNWLQILRISLWILLRVLFMNFIGFFFCGFLRLVNVCYQDYVFCFYFTVSVLCFFVECMFVNFCRSYIYINSQFSFVELGERI